MFWDRLSRFLRNKWAVIAVLAAVGFGVYANSLPNRMFWDDDDGILKNAYIKDWSYFGNYFTENLIAGAGLGSNYWRPMLLVTYSIEWHLWGAWPPGYHFDNAAIHILNAILLYLLLMALFRKPGVAFWTSLVFLVHPLQTEAVTYVSGRGDPLSVLFMLLAMNAYLGAKDWLWKGEEKPPKGYLGALLWFILALMTKESAIVLPAFLIAIDAMAWKQRGGRGTEALLAGIKKMVPFLIVAGFYLFQRATFLNFENTFNLYGKANYYTEHFSARLFTFLAALGQYFSLLVAPFNLHMERAFSVQKSFLSWPVVAGALILAASLVLIASAWKKKPGYSFSLYWYYAASAPFTGILVPVSGLIYEHWMYLPMVGFFLAIALAADELLAARPKPVLKALVVGAAAAIIVIFGSLTIARNRVWRDPITFYNDVVRYNDGSLRVWNNLGMAYSDAGQFDKAAEAYRRAIALDTERVSAPPRHNLGYSYYQLGDYAEAAKYFEEALSIDPKFKFSYNNLANAYLSLHKGAEALEVLKTGLTYFPDDPGFTANYRRIEDYLNAGSR